MKFKISGMKKIGNIPRHNVECNKIPNVMPKPINNDLPKNKNNFSLSGMNKMVNIDTTPVKTQKVDNKFKLSKINVNGQMEK